MFGLLQEQASDIAHKVDWLNSLLTQLSLFFTVLIVGAMIYFAIRYRRKDGQIAETPRIEGSNLLEAVWTIIPTIICIYIAYYGVVIYNDMRREDPNALEIGVWGQKWKWDFEYGNGKKTINEFVVPVNRQVKLVMKSRDVLHSFFIPAMRVKRDVVPGTYNSLYFTPIKTGTYRTFCTEYCGTEHSSMMASLRVVSEAEYDRWVEDRSEELAMSRMSPREVGEKLYTAKGCVACHSLDGSPRVGPSFLKLFGRKTVFSDGTELTADENYIQESILHPNKQVVKGFAPNLMPSFDGQLSDSEISGLIAFIKSIETAVAPAAPAAAEEASAAATPLERGQKIYAEKLCNTCHSLDGSRLVGPSFKGIYGREAKLVDGSTVKSDDAYLKNSILNPNAQVVDGFGPVSPMPPYQGQLSDAQIGDVIEFLKSVK